MSAVELEKHFLSWRSRVRFEDSGDDVLMVFFGMSPLLVTNDANFLSMRRSQLDIDEVFTHLPLVWNDNLKIKFISEIIQIIKPSELQEEEDEEIARRPTRGVSERVEGDEVAQRRPTRGVPKDAQMTDSGLAIPRGGSVGERVDSIRRFASNGLVYVVYRWRGDLTRELVYLTDILKNEELFPGWAIDPHNDYTRELVKRYSPTSKKVYDGDDWSRKEYIGKPHRVGDMKDILKEYGITGYSKLTSATIDAFFDDRLPDYRIPLPTSDETKAIAIRQSEVIAPRQSEVIAAQRTKATAVQQATSSTPAVDDYESISDKLVVNGRVLVGHLEGDHIVTRIYSVGDLGSLPAGWSVISQTENSINRILQMSKAPPLTELEMFLVFSRQDSNNKHVFLSDQMIKNLIRLKRGTILYPPTRANLLPTLSKLYGTYVSPEIITLVKEAQASSMFGNPGKIDKPIDWETYQLGT